MLATFTSVSPADGFLGDVDQLHRLGQFGLFRGGFGFLLVGQIALDLDVGALHGGQQALGGVHAGPVLDRNIADQGQQHRDMPWGNLLFQGGGKIVLELGAGKPLDQLDGGVFRAFVLACRLHRGSDDVLLDAMRVADVGNNLRRIGRRAAPNDREIGFDFIAVLTAAKRTDTPLVLSSVISS